jgi:hypothetical protein
MKFFDNGEDYLAENINVFAEQYPLNKPLRAA